MSRAAIPCLAAGLAVGLTFAGCVDDGAPDTGAVSAALASPTSFTVRRETYRRDDLVAGRPRPRPLSSAEVGRFTCDPGALAAGVEETRSRDGLHSWRLQCHRFAARTWYQDDLVLTLDDHRATDDQRAMIEVCTTRFGKYHTGGLDHFWSELAPGRVECRNATDPLAAMMATSHAGGSYATTVTAPPALGSPILPDGVAPLMPLMIEPIADQRDDLPPWALPPATEVIRLTSNPAPIVFDVISVADPHDLTTWKPDIVRPDISGYTVQFATSPAGLWSCDDWNLAPDVVATQSIALLDVPIFVRTNDAGKPVWEHQIEVDLPDLDVGPWVDDAQLTRTLWVRAVPRALPLGSDGGGPLPPEIPGLPLSPCTFVPSNWVPIGIVDDVTRDAAWWTVIQAVIADLTAKMPYPATELYDIEVDHYSPPRLEDRPTLLGSTLVASALGIPTEFPRIAQLSKPEFGVIEGYAFDPKVIAQRIYDAQPSSNVLEIIGNFFIDSSSSVSTQYETLKTKLAETVGSIGCTAVPFDGCEEVLTVVAKAAINMGLAALGIPPHIPNAREMIDHGIDYLATVAADHVVAQVPGGELVGGAAHLAARQMAATTARHLLENALHNSPLCAVYSDSGGCTFNLEDPRTWGLPDPFYRSHPATLRISIRPRHANQYLAMLSNQPEKIPMLGQLVIKDEFCMFADRHVTLPKVIPPEGIELVLPMQALFEAGAPGTVKASTGCTVPTPQAWAAEFKQLDPTGELLKGIRYPSATGEFLFTLETLRLYNGQYGLEGQVQWWGHAVGKVGASKGFQNGAEALVHDQPTQLLP